MNLLRNDKALIAVAIVLIVPLVLALAWNFPVTLGLLGIMLGAGVMIRRMAKPEPQQVSVMPSGQVIVESGRGQSLRLASPTQDVLPADESPVQHNWLVRKWLWLWNHPNHGMVMLGSVAVILFPLDDPIVVVCWWDDILAAILFCKHARDVYRLKWGKSPERMLAENAKGLVSKLAQTTAPVQSAFSPARLPAGIPE